LVRGEVGEPVGVDRRDHADHRAPALFVSHGSPLALVEDEFKGPLRRFGAHLRPAKSVIVVSAHWQTIRPLRVTSSRRPATLHDFEGFPAWLSTITYKCPGHAGLADQVAGVLTAAGIDAMTDAARGLDSGAWVPLSLIYPTARVPVIQVSLPGPATPQEMMAIGTALAPLRRDGVMLMGSGGVVHNPARVRFDVRDAPTEAWAVAFDAWIRDRIEALDTETLADYRRLAPMAHLAAPSSEHLDPLFFVLGARLPGDAVTPLIEGFHGGNLSLRSFVLSGRRAGDRRLPDGLTADI
jgi:4,5-DOPA dioxygenase extradiol